MQGLEGFFVRPNIESPQAREAARVALTRMQLWRESTSLRDFDEGDALSEILEEALISRFNLVSILGGFGKEFFDQSNSKVQLTDSPWWGLTDARFEYGRRRTDTGIWYISGRRADEGLLINPQAADSLNRTGHERLVRSFVGQTPEKMFERFASAFEIAIG